MTFLHDVVEVIRKLNHHKRSKTYCPRCSSPNIHLDDRADYWLAPPKYVCDQCGYRGPIVMEIEKTEE